MRSVRDRALALALLALLVTSSIPSAVTAPRKKAEPPAPPAPPTPPPPPPSAAAQALAQLAALGSSVGRAGVHAKALLSLTAEHAHLHGAALAREVSAVLARMQTAFAVQQRALGAFAAIDFSLGALTAKPLVPEISLVVSFAACFGLVARAGGPERKCQIRRSLLLCGFLNWLTPAFFLKAVASVCIGAVALLDVALANPAAALFLAAVANGKDLLRLLPSRWPARLKEVPPAEAVQAPVAAEAPADLVTEPPAPPADAPPAPAATPTPSVAAAAKPAARTSGTAAAAKPQTPTPAGVKPPAARTTPNGK